MPSRVFMTMLGILSVGTFAAASRPEVKAGYDCTQSCDKRACKISDFQWDLLDGLHHHAGLRIAGNGSVFYDTSKNRPGEELYSCNPAESQNQSMLMQHARTQGVKNILSLHPPKTTNPSFNSSSEVFQLLANTTNRANAVATACSMAAAGGFDGLSVDFEGKWTNNVAFRDVFTAFVAELAAACTSQSPALSVCSALAHDLNYDVAEDANAQAKAAMGGIVLMTYDYLFVTSSGKNSLSRSDTPMYVEEFMGPASPNNNVNSSIHRALELGVPASALLMGIAWYGKEVPTVGPELGAKMNLSTTPAAHGRLQRSYNYQAPLAEQRANTVGGGRRWDNVSKTPWYSFQDTHRPWLHWQGFYDDAESLQYKYDMVKSLGLRGVLLWNLNGCTLGEAPAMWQAVEKAFGRRGAPLGQH